MKVSLIFISLFILPLAALFAQSVNKDNFYKNAWSSVSAFDAKGLPKSALDEVNKIYKSAVTDKNNEQIIKSLIHKLKFTSSTEKDALVQNIEAVSKEITISKFPVRQLLYSLRADMYWHYYQRNRWTIGKRTTTINFDKGNLETWSLADIVAQTSSDYELSLSDDGALKTVNMRAYDEILIKGNKLGRAYRPTLFDFLGH
ncbi:MAG TPA: hypothetical protein VF691_21000, partial [Cytophagaceae bacterium]